MDTERILTEIIPSFEGEEADAIRRAYELAVSSHNGQARESGEPYITHPVAVAAILYDMDLDAATIQAALLHDIVEDTEVTLDQVRAQFGDEVAQLVDGVTKLARIRRLSRLDGPAAFEQEQAENLRKIFLATVDDVRVIFVKLADRLHNMQTLGSLSHERQVRMARETVEIYAPLANRLGIWQFKWQLEDLALRFLAPEAYRQIAGYLSERRAERDAYVQEVAQMLEERLRDEGIAAQVSGRPKHLYSIYTKMREKGRTFDQIYDVRGVRIIVEEVGDCYAALGLVHTLWRPIPGEFDDYIGTPKDNGYQSLHTAVLGPDGKPLEVQIRTQQMHQVAEYGIAAHWRYKERARRNAAVEAKIAWLRQVSEWRRDVSDPQEFVDSLRSDVISERIYVFTPKGDIVDLPAGSTPVDMAYYIHTDIGDHCRGARVNGRLVSLDHTLHTGDQVEILTSRKGGPSRDWLNANLGYITTARARQKVRQWFRRQEREQNIAQGREILERELRRLGLDSPSFEDIARLFKFSRVEDLLAAIGYGDISPIQIANKIDDAAARKPDLRITPLPQGRADLRVTGVGDLLTRLAGCCSPVPGDEIVGFITRGKGITIHRADCVTLRHIEETERLIPVSWGPTREVYPVVVHIEAFDRPGLLRDIASAVSDAGISMSAANVTTHEDQTATIVATLGITSIGQLSQIMGRIESIRDVVEVHRQMA
ncbi:MAG TPA: bifunctional (p)ppGpp synthetase/guanosine-3',5'-bis(diphosphate) 3'-pyrophosphohydrolase [Anaerolineae bacterium]|nr:bifunctional (p)ppGpp synthetase/guanosine-3',5'-bis(diphosphate) 3'-pyrophosphohydrolase [Anaerolineae bacterium]HOR00631.1 bifunctional (p)ppGpp synthetase/guanosine-3',5'-bis(diphosphate) 3'-pyrophosphohydrolase [Anaerolineae bacterium]HPL29312.1 bifunctional (p)ppGpp synthetase/guanosine-3',5'-bis(diphosphate) 3'-pyrophosphohydrolase [Anaerolineae bacterium]